MKLKSIKPRCVFPGHTDTDCDIQAYGPYKYLQGRRQCVRRAIYSRSQASVRIHWARE